MGSELWLWADKGTKTRVRSFLSAVEEREDDDPIFTVGDYSCWVEWSGQKMRVSSQISAFPKELGYLVARELARRFEFSRVGADAVGWYDDANWKSESPRGARAKYGDHESWIAWLKQYKFSDSHLSQFWSTVHLPPDEARVIREDWESLEYAVMAQFKPSRPHHDTVQHASTTDL